MATRITDTRMTSDLTRHTAQAAPGGGWAVSWLPGRVLTRDQAMTGMTIAEAVNIHADDLADSQHKMWLFIDGWVAELGITGTEAASLAAVGPEPARANRHGSPCPPWCTVDHAKVTDAERGTVIDSHYSAPMTSGGLPWDVTVKVHQHASRYGQGTPQVELIRISDLVLLGPGDADALAGLLDALADCPPERLRELAAEVRAAASIARDGTE